MIEVEIRAKVKTLAHLKNRILEIGAEYVGKEDQIDKVFGREKDLDDNHKIIEGHFSARIRKVNDSTKVEFKEIKRTGSGLEFSSQIPKIDDGLRLLQALDFTEAFTISKTRESYKLDGFTICLDKVDKLGNYIEIEHFSEDGENDSLALEECEEVLAKLDSNAIIESRKYGDLMQELINKRDTVKNK